MKRAAVAALITALTLSSCGVVRYDVKEDYKEYLDYAFDGNYSISDVMENETGIDSIERVWLVYYTDADGEEQSGEITVITEKGMDKKSVKREYDTSVLHFVWFARQRALDAEMRKLLSEHFEITEGESWVLEGDGFSIICQYSDCRAYDPDIGYSEKVTPGSGVKYTGVGLKEWARDETNMLEISVILTDESRISEFEESFAGFIEDFVELTESPQNYCFTLSTNIESEDGGREVTDIAEYCKILGEDSPANEFMAENVAKRFGIDTQTNAEEQ